MLAQLAFAVLEQACHGARVQGRPETVAALLQADIQHRDFADSEDLPGTHIVFESGTLTAIEPYSDGLCPLLDIARQGCAMAGLTGRHSLRIPGLGNTVAQRTGFCRTGNASGVA